MRAIRCDRGFTIVEMIIVLVLVAVLSMAAAPLLLALTDSIHYDQRRNHLVETSRFALDRMAIEIRSLSDSAGIQTAQPDAYAFESSASDPNSCDDGSTPTARSVSIQSTTPGHLDLVVGRTCGGVTQTVTAPLSRFLDSMSFTYYDAAGQVIATPATGAGTTIASIRFKAVFRHPGLTGRLDAPYTVLAEYAPKNLQKEETFLP